VFSNKAKTYNIRTLAKKSVEIVLNKRWTGLIGIRFADFRFEIFDLCSGYSRFDPIIRQHLFLCGTRHFSILNDCRNKKTLFAFAFKFNLNGS